MLRLLKMLVLPLVAGSMIAGGVFCLVMAAKPAVTKHNRCTVAVTTSDMEY